MKRSTLPRSILPLCIASMMLDLACSGTGSTLDGGTSTDGQPADTGSGAPDAGSNDTGPPPDGSLATATLIVPADNGLAYPIHLTPDLSTLFFGQAGRLQSTALTGGALSTDMGVAPGTWIESSGFNVFYLYYDLPMGMMPFEGTLRAIDGTKTSTPTQLARRANIFSISTDWSRVLISANIQGGATINATVTADIMGVGLTTAPKKFASNVPVGRWDPTRRAYIGACTPAGVFTSSITAMITACVPTSSTAAPPTTRVLAKVDFTTGAMEVLHPNVLNTIALGVDRAFVVYLDTNRQLWGVSRNGARTVMLADNSPVTSVLPLAGRRFAYTTVSGALKVAAWPAMTPTVLIASGADRIERRTANGRDLMYRKTPISAGLRDLYAISTSTAAPAPIPLETMPDGVPGDVAFTADGKTALWYGGVTFDGSLPIGAAMSQAIDGAGQAAMLASNVSAILTYQSTTNVFLMANTHHETDLNGNDRLAADLSVRPADGSGPLDVLQADVDARFYRLRRSTVIYRLPPGPMAGIWMRTLP